MPLTKLGGRKSTAAHTCGLATYHLPLESPTHLKSGEKIGSGEQVGKLGT